MKTTRTIFAGLILLLMFSAPALATEPEAPGTLRTVAQGAQITLVRANVITEKVLVAIDDHARDAKRMLVKFEDGYEIGKVPGTRVCVRNQRLLFEYRF